MMKEIHAKLQMLSQVSIKIIVAASIVAGMVGAVPSAWAGKPISGQKINIRLVGYMPLGHFLTQAADLMTQSLNSNSAGHFVVKHYPAATLFKNTDQHQAVMEGEAEIGYGAVSWFADQVPAIEVMDLPFLFNNEAQVKTALHGKFGEILATAIEKKTGLHVVSWLAFGPTDALGTTKKAIKRPTDLAGLKVRSFGLFPALILQTLGAAPTTIASSEVYTALQRGVADGAISLTTSFWTRKWYEVVNHITVVPLGYTLDAVYANKNWWDGLPKAAQVELQKAAGQASEYTFSVAVQKRNAAIESLRNAKHDVIEIPSKDFPEWKKKLSPVYSRYLKDAGPLGQQLIDLAQKAGT